MGVIYDAEAYIAATVNHLSLTWGGHKQKGGVPWLYLASMGR
jgi:hypothetical protein